MHFPPPSPEEIRGIYAGIERLNLSFNAPGWNSENPNFEEAIKAVRPAVIIEVGVYLGRSVIHTLNVAKKHGLSPVLYAVDTWHGEAGHPIGHLAPFPPQPKWDQPTQFQQFLANIKHAGFDGQVVPLQEFSVSGARVLRFWNVSAQMIYIDGDHSETGCYNDMNAYWPLLDIGGRMIGDDLHTEGGGVWRASGRFAKECGMDIRSETGQWVIDRTG